LSSPDTRRDLGQALPLDHLSDMARKLRLGQLLLGFRHAQVGEDVAAALGHRNGGFSLFAHCS